MFFVVDIGNSNIKFTSFDNDKVVGFSKLQTDKNKIKYDEIDDIVKGGNIKGIIVSSVVPELTNVIRNKLEQFSDKIITFKDDNLVLNIKKYPSNKPDFIDRRAGQDMIADICYGIKKYEKNFLTIDLGTAGVINCVDGGGYYTGSTIFSGLVTLSKYMSVCSQLKDFDVIPQDYNISPYYEQSINGGVFWGGIGMLEKNVEIAIKKSNLTNPKICVTGGYFKEIKDFVNFKYDAYDPYMTAIGLYEILKMNI
ncbi:MAG: type III pantothenate kinase [Rickettsiales bacterium]|jgi:pantothenate kinase type III|nr:type III pantothenate kinase [Rickettsiales bacterium]